MERPWRISASLVGKGLIGKVRSRDEIARASEAISEMPLGRGWHRVAAMGCNYVNLRILVLDYLILRGAMHVLLHMQRGVCTGHLPQVHIHPL